MPKRKRISNIEKRIKDGCGLGVGKEYIPWITIQDVPSKGRVTRLKGIKTERQHEFLSDIERNYFYLLEYSDKVIDIREQYPLLPIEDTLIIAQELGINHPKDPKTGEYIVMTTDFLVTIYEENRNVLKARTIKSKNDLLDKRVIEKFEIERVYWEKKEVDWGIVTEEEIDKVVALNISSIYSYRNIEEIDCFKDISPLEMKDLIYEFMRRIVDDNRSMREICLEFDTDMMLENGASISIFRHLLINKFISINLKKKIDINKNIDISINEENIDVSEVV